MTAGEHRSPMYSVVVPVHNRAAVVGPSLRSVQEQTWTEFECLVVDDGSGDGDDLARVVASLDDDRFRYVRQAHGGAGSARNRGIELARGRFVAFLDSDDCFLPHKLERCAGALADEPGDVLLYSQLILDRGLARTWIRPARGARDAERVDEYVMCTPSTIRTSTIVLSADLARRVRFDPTLPWFQDSDLAIRAANAGAVVRYLGEPLVVVDDRINPSRVSSDRDYRALLDYFERMRAAGEISERSYWAGRGWPCARVASRSNRPVAVFLYLQAVMRRPFPWRHAAVVAAQVVIPHGCYQAVANAVVRIGGQRVAGTTHLPG